MSVRTRPFDGRLWRHLVTRFRAHAAYCAVGIDSSLEAVRGLRPGSSVQTLLRHVGLYVVLKLFLRGRVGHRMT